ncbi:MAG: phenylalanine--tRNA ligase subunit alpha [Candidatus Paceibacterota bacterium]|jgi:phenylalanyl-tRNA synthetase alpha chain
MKNKLEKIKINALKDLKKIASSDELEAFRVKYLGRKSELTAVLRNLKDLPGEEKKSVGEKANEIREVIEAGIEQREAEIKNKEFGEMEEKERIDVTYPGAKMEEGHLHPLTQTRYAIEEIFKSMGFLVVEDREIEDEFHNFDALNMPKDHPARDMQDTFWLKSGAVPRTQTSSVQIRFMEKNKPPFRIVSPGRVFRKEASDATHESNFHQIECLMVDEAGSITVSSFKAVLHEFMKGLFGTDVKVRLRPSYFPFVEPGFETDVSCPYCGQKGCRICKNSGWIELGGSGIVNQKVFTSVGFPEDKYEGFAFGFGLERMAMIKFGIDDIRLFHSGDLRFLEQF